MPGGMIELSIWNATIPPGIMPQASEGVVVYAYEARVGAQVMAHGTVERHAGDSYIMLLAQVVEKIAKCARALPRNAGNRVER